MKNYQRARVEKLNRGIGRPRVDPHRTLTKIPPVFIFTDQWGVIKEKAKARNVSASHLLRKFIDSGLKRLK